MLALSEILNQSEKPALLIGNGINQFNGDATSSWKDLLGQLAASYDLKLSDKEMEEMSNTEFFDILDLARPLKERGGLQQGFRDLLEEWEPSEHHGLIVNWAKRHRVPIVTVNFDENLSRAVGAEYVVGKGFTHWYPWSSYFSDQVVERPRGSFAIWHAHGMMRYSQSIRLGLTHYMGSVERARKWVYTGADSLRAAAKQGNVKWKGRDTWLDILFFSPMVILGFGFRKDETFLRWLFLERARFHKINPDWKAKTWFVDTPRNGGLHRKPFFERLGMEYVAMDDYAGIYENASWRS